MLNLKGNSPRFVLNDILNATSFISCFNIIIIYNGYYESTEDKSIGAEIKLFSSPYKREKTIKLVARKLLYFGILKYVENRRHLEL